MWVFTNMRLILVDKQGLTGKKVDYQSIPYKSIVRFSKESTGLFDLDAELKLWLSGMSEPIIKEFSKKANVDSESCVVTMCCISNKQLKPKLKHHSSPLVLTVRAKYFGFQIMKLGTCRFFVSLTMAGEWSFQNHGVSQFFVVVEFYLAYSLDFYKAVSESQCIARLKRGLRDQFICCFHN